MPHIDMPPLRMPHAPITKLELDIPSITVMEGDTQKAPQKEIPPVKKGETPVPAMVKPPKEMPLPSAPATPRVIEMPPIVVEETDLSEVLKKPVTPPPAGLHAASTPAAVAAAAHVKEKADSQAQSGPFKGEINKILKDIKLPERRDFKGAADKKPSVAPAPGAVPEATIVSETVIPQSPQAAAARSAEPKGTISEISTIQPTAAPGESLATMITKEAEAKKSGIKSIGDGLVIPLRTLKEDLQHVITSRGMSLVRAVALEQDKKRDGPHLTAAEMAAHRQRSRRVFAVIFASAILFFLGVAALVGVYTIQNTRTSAVDIGPDNSILFAEQTVAFPIDEQSSSDIKRTLAQARGGSNATLGSITRIVPTINNGGIGPRPVTTREFFQALDVHAPDELIRALSDSFFMGIHTVDKNAPVLVFGVQSYDHAFAGMLAWEGTINADLGPFFTPVPPLAPDADGLPTTRPFRDIVMRNYDVRALRDDGNVIQLYYSFPTPNLLIIAESPYSFTEVLSRLQAERRL